MNIKKMLKKIKFLYYPYRKIKEAIIIKDKKKLFHQYGYQVLRDVVETLEEDNIKIFCVFGTLLGAIREHDFIKHDFDMDFGVIEGDDFSWEVLENALSKCGMKKYRQFELEGCITEQTYEKNGVTVDFFLHKVMHDRIKCNIYWVDESREYKNLGGHSVMYRYCPMITEFGRADINSISVPVPANNVEYLETIYGKGWKVPDPNYKHEEAVETEDNLEGIRVNF